MPNEKQLVPQLRFLEFKDLWSNKKYNQIYTFYSTNSFSREKLNYEDGDIKNIHYGDIHTKFSTLFDIERENVPFVNLDIDLSRIKDENYCQEGDLLIADASEDYNDIGKTTEIININNELLISGLHTFHARPNKYKMAVGFSGYLLQSWKVRKQVMTIAQGTKVLSLATSRLGAINLIIPYPPEQQKIASFLSDVDEKITQLTKKKTLLEQYKKGVMQKIFNQELRFKDDNGKEFPKWEVKKLGTLLDYEQPTKYIVESTEYDDSFKIPVLTAGKSFLLGYTNEAEGVYNKLPTIIFDDFTMANKYVDFEFKVKSSAMKILQPKNDCVNIKFVYEAIQMINYPKGDEHKRFWISEYSKIKIGYPCTEEQTKIANFLSDIDIKIEALGTKIENSKTFKKGLLQQMFV